MISIISIVEILYLSERNKIPLDFEDVRRKLLPFDPCYYCLEFSYEVPYGGGLDQAFDLNPLNTPRK